MPTFDDDVSVEVTAEIGAHGAKALQQQAPAPAIRGLMQEIKAYETRTVEAAVTGDREAAFQAMLLNPLMPGALGCKSPATDGAGGASGAAVVAMRREAWAVA